MNHFVVSARKYRPENFDDVVGQKAVTSTLKNAIDNNHLAQALLFTGPRGVGKTSCARILAKMVNQKTNTQPTDYAFNIFELDAASNNSVEDIRNLNDQVRIPPQTGKFKVYIIDEVHMLSTSAFNAFLKTLEEPPKHAIFILATTEKHKIIPTILSRCQVFDFKRITVQDIKEHLRHIATEEGVTAEDEALQIIAQKSDGAMRDALSTYDRVVSYCGTNLTRSAVAENLNILDFDTFLKTTDLILYNDIPGVLLHFNSILARGYDGQHFISGLASHFRDLLVCKDSQSITLLDVADGTKSQYQNQSKHLSMQQCLEFIDIANTCDFEYKLSQNKLLHVELCLMKLASANHHSKPKKKIHKINSPSETTSYKNNIPTKTKSTELEVKPTKSSSTNEDFNNNYVYHKLGTNTTKESSEKNNYLAESTKQKTNGLSLKSIQFKKNYQQKVNQAQDEQTTLQEEFSLEELKIAWKNFAKMMENKGKKLLASTLLADVPKLNDKTIVLYMPNETMKIELQQNKSIILKYLKNSLKNSTLDLQIIVRASKEKKYIHTNDEKYNYFVKTNPNVELLKQKLDLDY